MKRQFKIGAWVEWTSQSGSYQKTKVGKIIEIVEPGCRPQSFDRGMFSSAMADGLPRVQVSYAVAVWPASGNAKPKWYWPRVSTLKRTTKPDYIR